MKHILTVFIVLIPFISSSQKEVGHMISNKGDTIIFYKKTSKKRAVYQNNVLDGDVNLTAQFVHYYDEKGKIKKISQSKIKLMLYNNKQFVNLPISLIGKRLHEVIAENDNYLLTSYYNHTYNYFYVFKKEGLQMVEKKERHSFRKKLDNKLLEKRIRPYFNDCPELISLIKKGIDESNYRFEFDKGALVVKNILFKNVSNFNCVKN